MLNESYCSYVVHMDSRAVVCMQIFVWKPMMQLLDATAQEVLAAVSRLKLILQISMTRRLKNCLTIVHLNVRATLLVWALCANQMVCDLLPFVFSLMIRLLSECILYCTVSCAVF